MPSTFSTLKIQLMATGENNTTWGDVTNLNLGTALEEAIVGSADVTFASADVTLTLTDTNASQTARNMRLRCTGTTGGSTRNLIVPAIEKPYIVSNDCADSVIVKNTTGTGITVPAGKTMWVYNNATNVVDAVTNLSSLTLGAALPVSSGGTGTATAFTTGSVVFAGASGVYSQDNANLFWDNANDRLGIGTATPLGILHASTESGQTSVFIDAYGGAASVSGRTASGTRTSPTTVTANQSLTFLGARAYNGTSFTSSSSALINMLAAETWTTIANGSYISFSTTPTGSTTRAEAMRITSAGDVGIGTGTPRGNLSVGTDSTAASTEKSIHLGYTAANFYGFRLLNVNSPGSFPAGTFSIQRGDTTAWLNALSISDGGNVGIGTPSNGRRLEVWSGAAQTDVLAGSTSSGFATVMRWDNSAGQGFIYNTGAYPLLFGTNSTERMRIDSSGNVLVGTTTANGILSVAGNQISIAGGGGSGSLGIQIKGTAISAIPAAQVQSYIATGDSSIGVAGDLLIASRTDVAANIRFITGTTPAERMRIDGSGNVGIGTTAPGTRLDVVSAGNPTITLRGTDAAYSSILNLQASGGGTSLINATGGSNALGLYTATVERVRIDSSGNVGIGTSSITPILGRTLQIGDGTTNSSISLIGSGASTTGDGYIASTAVAFEVYSRVSTPMIFGTNDTERMRIDSSGNVGIGTTSPSGKFNISAPGLGQISYFFGGTSVNYTDVDTNIFRSAAGSERMRIDSSGNVLVGKSATNDAALGAEMQASGAVSSARSGTTNAQATMIVYSTGAAAYRFYVTMDGVINATSTSIAAISDIRLKENVRDLDAGLDTILALKPRRFDWKEGKGKDVKDDMGFIAQEVETVLPALIGGWKAGEGEPDDLKSVKAGDLIPVLVKAIQELTARVAQLEGN